MPGARSTWLSNPAPMSCTAARTTTTAMSLMQRIRRSLSRRPISRKHRPCATKTMASRWAVPSSRIRHSSFSVLRSNNTFLGSQACPLNRPMRGSRTPLRYSTTQVTRTEATHPSLPVRFRRPFSPRFGPAQLLICQLRPAIISLPSRRPGIATTGF